MEPSHLAESQHAVSLLPTFLQKQESCVKVVLEPHGPKSPLAAAGLEI